MPSQVDIANMALSYVGNSIRISSLNENSPAADQCELWMDHSKDTILRAYDWTFATKRISLTAASISGSQADLFQTNFTERYSYPSDALKIQYITTEGGDRRTSYPFTVENHPSSANTRIILSNINDAIAVYTYEYTNYPTLPPHFVQPLAILLAANVAYVITGKMELAAGLNNLYFQTFQAFTAQDANESNPVTPPEAEWIQVREGSVQTRG